MGEEKAARGAEKRAEKGRGRGSRADRTNSALVVIISSRESVEIR